MMALGLMVGKLLKLNLEIVSPNKNVIKFVYEWHVLLAGIIESTFGI